MRELAYLNGLDDGSSAAPPPAPTVIATPVVRGRGRARGLSVRGAHVVRSSVPAHSVPRSAVAAVPTPRHGATAPDPYVSKLPQQKKITVLCSPNSDVCACVYFWCLHSC